MLLFGVPLGRAMIFLPPDLSRRLCSERKRVALASLETLAQQRTDRPLETRAAEKVALLAREIIFIAGV